MNTLIIILTKVFDYIRHMLLLSNNIDALARGQIEIKSDIRDLTADMSSMQNHLQSLTTNYLELDNHGSKALVEYCKENRIQINSVNMSLVNIDKRMVRLETKMNGGSHPDAMLGEAIDG